LPEGGPTPGSWSPVAGFFFPRPRPPRRRRFFGVAGVSPSGVSTGAGAADPAVAAFAPPAGVDVVRARPDPLARGVGAGPSTAPSPASTGRSAVCGSASETADAPPTVARPRPRPRPPRLLRRLGAGRPASAVPADPSPASRSEVSTTAEPVPSVMSDAPFARPGSGVDLGVEAPDLAAAGARGARGVRLGACDGSPSSSWMRKGGAEPSSADPCGASSRTRKPCPRRRPSAAAAPGVSPRGPAGPRPRHSHLAGTREGPIGPAPGGQACAKDNAKVRRPNRKRRGWGLRFCD